MTYFRSRNKFFFFFLTLSGKLSLIQKVSYLGWVGSGNELQRQRKGSWNLGKRKAERMCHVPKEGEG